MEFNIIFGVLEEYLVRGTLDSYLLINTSKLRHKEVKALAHFPACTGWGGED